MQPDRSRAPQERYRVGRVATASAVRDQSPRRGRRTARVRRVVTARAEPGAAQDRRRAGGAGRRRSREYDSAGIVRAADRRGRTQRGAVPGADMPALQRYTGVLYDALEAGGFDTTQWSRAGSRLAVASALFGLLGPDDPIPAYRLSGNSTLPALGPLRTLWRPALEPLLAARDDLVVDLRSGTYATLARVPGAVTVRVVTADSAGNRKTVSHHNKAYKGALAATLATSATEPSTVDELLTLTSRSGLNLTRTDENTLELLTD